MGAWPATGGGPGWSLHSLRDQRLLHELAEVLYKLGDLRGSAEVYSRLSHELQRQGFLLKAIATLKLVQKLDPQPSIVFRLAELHALIEYKADALEYLALLPATLEVLRFKATLLPDDRETQLHLAELLLDAGDEVGANAVLTRLGVERSAVREERRLAAMLRTIDFSRLN